MQKCGQLRQICGKCGSSFPRRNKTAVNQNPNKLMQEGHSEEVSRVQHLYNLQGLSAY